MDSFTRVWSPRFVVVDAEGFCFAGFEDKADARGFVSSLNSRTDITLMKPFRCRPNDRDWRDYNVATGEPINREG